MVPSTAGQVVALDCKALHLIRARASESRLIVGQVAVAGKSTEITTIPALIGVPDLAGATTRTPAGTWDTLRTVEKDHGRVAT